MKELALDGTHVHGGIERITTTEATSCLVQSGAADLKTQTDVTLTNRRSGDTVDGLVRDRRGTKEVLVAVIDGGDDAPQKGWDDDPTARHQTLANTVVFWWGTEPAALSPLVDCLNVERADA